MIKQYFTIRVNGYDQKGLMPFETTQGALLCVRCWANDGRIKTGDRVEIVEHIETAQEINSRDLLGV